MSNCLDDKLYSSLDITSLEDELDIVDDEIYLNNK